MDIHYKLLKYNRLAEWGGANAPLADAIFPTQSPKSFQFITTTMRDFKKSLRALALLLGLALLLPLSANAQYYKGSLLNDDPTAEWKKESMIHRDATITWTISNNNFGSQSPLGTGIAILVGAGLGYVALKKKREDKQ